MKYTSMVEFGNNSLDPDKEFDVLHGVLEFSVDDCLEEGESAEEWDIGDAQCLGPIPYDVLMEPPMTSNEQLVASISGAPEQKQLPKQRKLAGVQESVSFHTQSPVSVLESSESDNDIPVRSRSKRLIDLGINPKLSTSKQTSNARRRKECRKRLPVDMDPVRSSPKKAHSSLHVSDLAYEIASKPRLPIVKKCVHCQSSNTPLWRDGPLGPRTLCNACGLQYKSGRLFPEYRPLSSPTYQIASKPHLPIVQKCAHCQSSKTPLWRDGPLGPRTLCNACGLRYKSGRLFPEYRPLSSPTFVPSQHSNSHKKVAEMRSQAKQLKVEIKVAPLSSKKAANNEDPSTEPLMEANFSEQPSPELEIDGTPEQTQLHVDNTSSHVSLMESSHSYLKYKSKYIHCVGAEPWVSPSPSCEKTSGEETSMEMHLENNDKSLDNKDRVLLQKGSNSCPQLAKKKKKCTHCQSTMTTLWREGPLGSQTLCDACGLQCGLDPEYRLKASPTFIPSQHSNDDRNIVKMRANHLNDSLTAGIKTAGAPEQKHVEGIQLPKHVETFTHISLLESSPSYRKFRLKYFKHAGEEKSFEMHVENNDKSLDHSDCASLQNGSNPYPAVGNKCAHCQTTKSPQGRQGPLGPHTLCSACGQKYQTGCLVPEYRPAASPTFVPSEVSNDHRKIIKMAQSTAGIENKRCAHCESTKTPMWRRGPLGPSTLCNACGKQYKLGHLVPEYRPKGSPTFVPSKHSNKHIYLMKMREKPENDSLTADIKTCLSTDCGKMI